MGEFVGFPLLLLESLAEFLFGAGEVLVFLVQLLVQLEGLVVLEALVVVEVF